MFNYLNVTLYVWLKPAPSRSRGFVGVGGLDPQILILGTWGRREVIVVFRQFLPPGRRMSYEKKRRKNVNKERKRDENKCECEYIRYIYIYVYI